MSAKECEVLVVGAGPSGTACACTLVLAGRDCLLVDAAAFPRDKLCGGGLTPKAQALLEELFPGLDYDYLPIKRMSLYMNSQFRGTYTLPCKEIRVVQRKTFDALLLDEYRKMGGAFLQERLQSVREREDGRIEATMQSGLKIFCRYLVGADGANSRVRRFLSPESRAETLILEQYLPHTDRDDIVFDFSPRYGKGYFYIFPNREFDAAGASLPQKQALADTLKDFGIEANDIRGALIKSRQDYPEHPHIFLVGDAGGWCDNLSYEGIYFALATGRNAANAIVEGTSFREANREVQTIKRRRSLAARLFYNPVMMALVRLISSHQRLTERILGRHVY